MSDVVRRLVELALRPRNVPEGVITLDGLGRSCHIAWCSYGVPGGAYRVDSGSVGRGAWRVRRLCVGIWVVRETSDTSESLSAYLDDIARAVEHRSPGDRAVWVLDDRDYRDWRQILPSVESLALSDKEYAEMIG